MPTKLWIMLINKTATAQNNLALSIANFSAATSAKVFQSIGTTGPHALADIPIANGSVTVSLPACSINLLVVAAGP